MLTSFQIPFKNFLHVAPMFFHVVITSIFDNVAYIAIAELMLHDELHDDAGNGEHDARKEHYDDLDVTMMVMMMRLMMMMMMTIMMVMVMMVMMTMLCFG